MNSIRQVFGNHNEYRLFINLVHLMNDNNINITELPKPIFSRHVNGPDAQFINDKNKHNKLMLRLSRELNTKYTEYIRLTHFI